MESTSPVPLPEDSLALALARTETRRVFKCVACRLNQYETANGLCRRCANPLPIPNQPIAKARHTAPPARPREVAPRPFSRKAIGFPLGRRIRELRTAAQKTQGELALACTVPRTYISRIENGRLMPGPRILGRLAEQLNTDIPSLFGSTTVASHELEDCFVGLTEADQLTVLTRVKEMVSSSQ